MTGPGAAGSGERLQKVLAAAGVAGRRGVEEMVRQGRVRVNGRPARIGQRIERDVDVVEVDGTAISLRGDLVYYLLNKPRGVVTTASDPHGRPTVLDGLPAEPRVYPVGRLDMDSEGLLLLTNDGDLAQRVMHPSGGCEKEYLAAVEGRIDRAALSALRRGVELPDSVTAPARVSSPQRGMLRIVLTEGRNRQVRRMCAAVGLTVTRLVRTRIGPLRDARLAPGQWRELTTAELRSLEAAASAEAPAG
ncbi:MAG: pseudouridine synthase [bacterium]|nr:pseudouridine synthase [bacterium]